MAKARTDIATEIYTHVLTFPSALWIYCDVNREVNQSWGDNGEPMRLTYNPGNALRAELEPFNDENG